MVKNSQKFPIIFLDFSDFFYIFLEIFKNFLYRREAEEEKERQKQEKLKLEAENERKR